MTQPDSEIVAMLLLAGFAASVVGVGLCFGFGAALLMAGGLILAFCRWALR